MLKFLPFCPMTCLCAPVAHAQQSSPQPTSTPNSARAVFMDRNGKTLGTAILIDTPNGILIGAEPSNLPPGVLGFHIHQTGKCDPATGFASAARHYDPCGAKHGSAIEGGPHAGDMPNQTIEQGGTLKAEVFNTYVRFNSGNAPLFDQDGSALVVHATADDYCSQPSGNAGDRLACGVIQR